jgi:hypothetical protein
VRDIGESVAQHPRTHENGGVVPTVVTERQVGPVRGAAVQFDAHAELGVVDIVVPLAPATLPGAARKPVRPFDAP